MKCDQSAPKELLIWTAGACFVGFARRAHQTLLLIKYISYGSDVLSFLRLEKS